MIETADGARISVDAAKTRFTDDVDPTVALTIDRDLSNSGESVTLTIEEAKQLIADLQKIVAEVE